ncbi:MAG: SRPBCC family protein [Phycisphaerales bacterium]
MTVASKHTTQLSLPSDLEITMTRIFEAPRAIVFDAWTKPELLRRWWGPPGWTLVTCDADLHIGGSYRYVVRNPSGNEMDLRGTYRELSRPDRIVHTQTIVGCPAQGSDETLVTTVLSERDGVTTLTSTLRYATKALRDTVMQSGIRTIDGVYNKLDSLLASGVLAS